MTATPLTDPAPRRLGPAEAAFVAANRWVLIVLLGAMAVLVCANVISRYAFGHSFSWVEEVSRYLMIWVSFLGLGPALRVGGHIAVESLPQSLPAAGARTLRWLVVAVMAAALLVMLWLGVEYALFGWEQETPVLGWPLGIVYLAIPAGATTMLIHLAFVARHWAATGETERVEGFDPQAL